MDFSFIEGSMESVVGEKIARAVDIAIKRKAPFVIISKSGGARMMEAALSLMQMAKTSVKLAQLDALLISNQYVMLRGLDQTVQLWTLNQQDACRDFDLPPLQF